MHGNAITPCNLILCPVPSTSSKFAHIELVMDAEKAEQDVRVRAAVGLHRAAGLGQSQMASSEDPARLLFAEREVQESCLTIDGIFHLDTGQEKVLELARPQLALVPLGYSVSLLLWDPHGSETQLPLQDIIWQVIDSVFQELEATEGDTRGMQTVSLVQVCAQGGAWDLLRPGGQALQVMDIAPLGLMVEEVMEIAVPDARAAMSIYAWGLGALPAPFPGCMQCPVADGCSAAQGASSLFTLTLEWELEGCGCRRSALRILAVSGGPGPEPLSPLLGALATGHPPASAGSLPWVIERLLEGNSLTFLLLCMTLPDTSGEDILAALALAERVKGLAKTVSPTHWDPVQEATVRRVEIRGLRAKLLAGAGRLEQERAVAQLRRALQELQVLKSQRWEKKQMATKAFRANQMHQPGAKDLVPAENPALGKQPRTQEPLDGPSLEQGEGASAAESCWRGNSQGPRRAEQGLPEEPLQGKAPWQWAPSGAGVARSPCQPCLSQPCLSLEVQFSLAKARRQRLQAQHHLLLQQELGEFGDEVAPGQERDTAHRQWEVTVLSRSLEAARREREMAEEDLEALLHSHRQEMEAWRQHTLQVFQAQRRLAEEQAEALDRQYRVLLQEALQDAVELSAQNQQLRAAKQQGAADAATQTS